MTRLSALFLVTGVTALAQTGQIAVTVQNTLGIAVPGALVRVGARPFRNTLANFHVIQKTTAYGKVTFLQVPQGPYEVCAQLPGGLLLDSCAWVAQPVTTFLQPGSTINVTVVLKTGKRVTVQVDDAARLLSKEAFPGAKLRMEISARDVHAVPMAVTAAGNSRQFSALVPADADLRLHVRSSDFQITDATGNKLNMKDAAQFIPVHSPAANTPALLTGATASPILTLQVVGVQ
jgi:hypothetical protein